jgi:hypothetical protein
MSTARVSKLHQHAAAYFPEIHLYEQDVVSPSLGMSAVLWQKTSRGDEPVRFFFV